MDKVIATGVNIIYFKIRNKEFKIIILFKKPFILGQKLESIITNLNVIITKFKVGDKIYLKLYDYKNHYKQF